MNKILALLFVCAVIVGLGLLTRYTILVNSEKMQLFDPSSPQEYAVHTNSVYNLSFSYPKRLEVVTHSPERMSIASGSGESAGNVVDLHVVANPDNLSLIDLAVNQIHYMCATDVPGGSLSCTDVVSVSEFNSINGVEGIQLYITRVRTDLTDDSQEQERSGPYFILSLNNADTLVIAPSQMLEQSAVDRNVMVAVAESVFLR